MSYRYRVSHKYLLTLICLLLTFSTGSALAQEFHRDPQPPLRFDPVVSTDKIEITGTVSGPIAHIQVAQTVSNQSDRIAESVVLFPIPAGATTTGFRLTTDQGLTVEGSILQKDNAVEIYEEYVRQVRDPAILEFLGDSIYRARIFPIAPNADATVTLSYDVIVRSTDGLRKLQLPLRAFSGERDASSSISVQIDFHSEQDIRPLYSPTHELLIDRDHGGITRVAVNPSRDSRRFELFYGTSTREIDLDLLSYQPSGEDGYFAMLVSPPLSVVEERTIAKDVIVVLDVSGSMEGDKLAQAKKAASYIVDQLNPGDRFNVLAFSTGVRFWDAYLRSVEPSALSSAHEWLDRLSATGSTDINSSLLEAIGLLESDGQGQSRPSYVLFLTDGLPTQGETDPAHILTNISDGAAKIAGLRLFTFGVGYDVNTDLLNELGRKLHGRSSYVTPDETIDGVLEEFYSKISSPVLTGITLDFGTNTVVDEVYPAILPDLFAGEQLVVLGRYHGGSTANIVLRGMIGDEERVYRYASLNFVDRGGDPSIARLWATRKVGYLLEQIRLYGPNPEVVDAIVDLSLRFGIMTPYTSYLVEEPTHEVHTGNQGGADDRSAGGNIDPRSLVDANALNVAAESAAAPASGAEAVIQSEEREAMQSANYAIENTDVAHVQGKTFVRQDRRAYPFAALDNGHIWVDVEYQASMTVETVLFGSERYFEIAAQYQLYPWLALSSEMVLALDMENAAYITLRAP